MVFLLAQAKGFSFLFLQMRAPCVIPEIAVRLPAGSVMKNINFKAPNVLLFMPYRFMRAGAGCFSACHEIKASEAQKVVGKVSSFYLQQKRFGFGATAAAGAVAASVFKAQFGAVPGLLNTIPL